MKEHKYGFVLKTNMLVFCWLERHTRRSFEVNDRISRKYKVITDSQCLPRAQKERFWYGECFPRCVEEKSEMSSCVFVRDLYLTCVAQHMAWMWLPSLQLKLKLKRSEVIFPRPTARKVSCLRLKLILPNSTISAGGRMDDLRQER